MRICPIASSSSGNCIYVGALNKHFLIDVGISKKRVEEGLRFLGITGDMIEGIFITHEHSDHISGLGVFLRKYPCQVYGSRGTIMALMKDKSLGRIDPSLFVEINPGTDYAVGEINIHPFSISHDATEPVGYRIEALGTKMAIATDMGYYDFNIINNLKELDALVLEANHDVRMLESGNYPYQLKKRILSNVGHLSNESAGRLLNSIIHKGLKAVYLGHLSKENNLPELAFETVRLEVEMADNPYHASDFRLMVANKDTPSELIEI